MGGGKCSHPFILNNPIDDSKQQKQNNMETIILKNGNIAVITNVRWTWDRCLFTCMLYDKNGFWNHKIQEEYHIGYYNSPKEYINCHY